MTLMNRFPQAITATIKTCKRLTFGLRCFLHSAIQSNKIDLNTKNKTRYLERVLHYIEMNPRYLPAYIRACELLFESEEYYQAYELSRTGLKIKARCRQLKRIKRLCLATLLRNHGFRKAAELFLLNGQPKDANRAIRSALIQYPGDLATLLTALEVNIQLNNNKRSLNIAKELKAKHPNNMTEESYACLCKDLINAERKNDALLIANDFLAEFPTNFNALKTICCLTYKANQLQKCLKYAQTLVKTYPVEKVGYEYKFKVLKIQGKWNEALLTLIAGLKMIKKRTSLLTIGSEIDPSSASREESIEIIERIISIDPFVSKYHNRKLIMLLSHGLISVAYYHAKWLLNQKESGKNFIFKNDKSGKDLYVFANNIMKSKHDLRCYHWSHSFQTFTTLKQNNSNFSHQPFQYWSQGNPPEEILKIKDEWDRELTKIGLKNIILFDHNSALKWILTNTPDLAESFQTAFHYAVEADIFRIAYALKNDCIWIDSDMVISESVAATLSKRLVSAETTLYLKRRNPGLSNGFFATKKSSPFFTKIAQDMKGFSFKGKKPSKELVLNSFGPTKYTKTFLDLLKSNNKVDLPKPGEYPTLNLNDWNFNFLNKSTFGSEKPEKNLAYFGTNDNWNKFVNANK